MMKIPNFLSRDDYLQNPVMKKFLKEHKIKLVETREELLETLEKFANKNEENENIVKKWLSKVMKEGSKEVCYKKIYHINDDCYNPVFVEQKINNEFPDCPMKAAFEYNSTDRFEMIEYQIIKSENNKVQRIIFTFTIKYLCGDLGREGETTTYPVFIEVYLDNGFVISRAKAKSTLYPFDGENYTRYGERRINTMMEAEKLIDKIIDIFEFEAETDPRKAKNLNAQMLYKLYDSYSVTPADITKKIDGQKNLIQNFVDLMFSNLELDIRNKEKALKDLEIFMEKFIAINGNNEDIFTKDRFAYLVKISSDDESELTSIDAKSHDNTVPLQCTEAFYDSKKSVISGRKCRKLSMVFKRNENTCFTGKRQQLEIQFGAVNNHGFFKTLKYAEEEDIQNVLQTIFRNY